MPRKKSKRKATKRKRQPRRKTRGHAKIQLVMHEFKHHQLHSGSPTGPLVRSRRQAVAIALSEQRRADAGVRKRRVSRKK